MKKFALLMAGFTMLAFAACENGEDNGGGNGGYVDPYGRSITTVKITPTVLTVTVEGKADGFEQADLVQGQIGIMYCPERKDAAELFEEWQSTGTIKDNDVKMGGKTKKSNDGTISSIVEGLEQNTSYSACVYYKPVSGKKRLISPVFTFKTKVFDVQAQTEEVSDKKYYSVTLNGIIKGLDPDDAKACRVGFVVSEEENPTVDNSKVVEIEKSTDNRISYELRSLRPAVQYHYRIFIQPLGQEEYLYGTNVAFSTKSTDDMAVDLGLSVEWSTMLLGAEEPGARGNLYFWGDVNPATSGSPIISTENGLRNTVFYDNVTMSGNTSFSISGTQYDAATYLLGEGWRMPTREEFEELLANCSLGVEYDPNGTVASGGNLTYNGQTYYIDVVHLSEDNMMKINCNGKTIKIPTCDYGYMTPKPDGTGYSFTKYGDFVYVNLWCADVINSGGPLYYETYGAWVYEPEIYEIIYGGFSLSSYTSTPTYAYSILPVRDKK